MLPVLGRAREKARRAVCVGNLHQIGQVVLVYEHDFGVLPTSTHAGYILWNGTNYQLYGRILAAYGKSLGHSFFCPSSARFPARSPATGVQNLGQPGRLTAGTYYARSHAQGAPVRWEPMRQALLADLFDPGNAAVNHAAGINTLYTDGSVMFWQQVGNWPQGDQDAWYPLDDRPLAGHVTNP